jgi:hypothetical protein
VPHYVRTCGWIRDFRIFFAEVTDSLANYANKRIRLCLLTNLNPVLRLRFCCINQARLLKFSNPTIEDIPVFRKAHMQKLETNVTIENLLHMKEAKAYFCQSIYIETSVRNKCRCSFYCALLTLHVLAPIHYMFWPLLVAIFRWFCNTKKFEDSYCMSTDPLRQYVNM